MAKYNQRIWESVKEKVIEVIHEELDKALTQTTSEEPAPQSEGEEDAPQSEGAEA